MNYQKKIWQLIVLKNNFVEISGTYPKVISGKTSCDTPVGRKQFVVPCILLIFLNLTHEQFV